MGAAYRTPEDGPAVSALEKELRGALAGTPTVSAAALRAHI
jgi:hypothetical protein